MNGETFKDACKKSYDGTFIMKLFQLPTHDGTLRLSIQVMTSGGRVFFQLPNHFWLESNDLIDWSENANIAFFTVKGRKMAFIYDVTFMSQVSCDLKPNDRLEWDEAKKCWTITEVEFSTVQNGQEYVAGSKRNLRLPYLKEKTKEKYKVIPLPNERYTLVLTKVDRNNPMEPDLWTVGIVDLDEFIWAVEALPYYVKEEAVRINKGRVAEFYGFDKGLKSCSLFRFDCDEIGEQGCLRLYVNGFGSAYPERVIWEESSKCWRVVIQGEVIRPRPFYYDDMYSKDLPMGSKDVELEVLKLLPENEKVQCRIESSEKKKEGSEDLPLDDFSGDETLSETNERSKLIKKIKLVVFLLLVIDFGALMYTAKLNAGYERGPAFRYTVAFAIIGVTLLIVGMVLPTPKDK